MMENNSVYDQSALALLTGSVLCPGDAPIVLVVIPLDQFAVHNLFPTARTGHILAEIRVWAAKITKQRQRLFENRLRLLLGHRILNSPHEWRKPIHTIMSIWI